MNNIYIHELCILKVKYYVPGMYCLEEALFLKELSHCLHVHSGRRQFSTLMPAFQIMCIYILCIPHIGHRVYKIVMALLYCIVTSGLNYNVIF